MWRHNYVSGITVNYATCSPDLLTCPDGICDPLEHIAQNMEVNICPQDCVPAHKIYGPHVSNVESIGIKAASGLCTCDDIVTCSCGPLKVNTKKIKNEVVKESSINTDSWDQTLINLTSGNVGWYNNTCGKTCYIFIAVSSLGLISFLVLIYMFKTSLTNVIRKMFPRNHIKNGELEMAYQDVQNIQNETRRNSNSNKFRGIPVS